MSPAERLERALAETLYLSEPTVPVCPFPAILAAILAVPADQRRAIVNELNEIARRLDLRRDVA